MRTHLWRVVAIVGSDLWSDISVCAVPATSVGGSGGEHGCGRGVVFPEFVDRRLDRKENGAEPMESLDRDGLGRLCGVLFPGGKGVKRIEVDGSCKSEARRTE
jgi:hypothetical protein